MKKSQKSPISFGWKKTSASIFSLLVLSLCIGLFLFRARIGPAIEMLDMINEHPEWKGKLQHVDSLLDLIVSEQSNISLYSYSMNETGLVDDSQAKIALNIQTPRFSAATINLMILAGYSQLVAEQKLNPKAKLKITEWEKFYLPFSDAGTHLHAMRSLNIKTDDNGFAKDPRQTVTFEQIADAVARYSDPAAADFLLHHISAEKIYALLEQHNCQHTQPHINWLGQYLMLTSHDSISSPEKWQYLQQLSNQEFRTKALKLNDRYRTDSKWRRMEIASLQGIYGRRPSPLIARKFFHHFGPQASVSDLNTIMAKTLQGSFPSREANEHFRALMQWPMGSKVIQQNFDILGMQSGSNLGILSYSLYAEKAGKRRVFSIILNNMPISAWVQMQGENGMIPLIKSFARGDTDIFTNLNQRLNQ